MDDSLSLLLERGASLRSTAPPPQVGVHPGPELDKLLPFFAPFSCFSEEAAELDNSAVMAREKETLRRQRDGPEKVMKYWERRHTDSEKDTEDESSNEALTTTESGQEEERQRKVVEKVSSLRKRELGAMGKDSGNVHKKLSGELGIRSGEVGRKLPEVSRKESREIYRRPSDLDQKFLEDLHGRESEGLKERLTEAGRRDLEELGKIELGEIGKMTTENAEKIEKGEKEDE